MKKGAAFSDRGRLSKNLKRGTVVFIALGSVWIVYTLVRAISASAELSGGQATAMWGIVLVTIPIAIIAGVLMIQPQMRRFNALRTRFPEADVSMMALVNGLSDTLRHCGFIDGPLRISFVFVVREGMLEIWKGFREPRVVAAISADTITGVRIGLASMGTATAKIVGFELADGDGEPVWLQMMPEQLGKRWGTLPPTSEYVEATAERLRIAVETAGGQKLPPVTWAGVSD